MGLHYNAFISYKHAELDNKIAAQIEKDLEHYHIPLKIQKKTGVKKIERIFRDKDELPITSDLTDTINEALVNSDYLIVICSKSTCLSTWVEREINLFLQTHPLDHVLTVLAEGEPYEVVPKVLLSRQVQRYNSYGQIETYLEAVEPLSCDYRLSKKEAKNTELPRLAATLVGCSYNELMNRQRQYRMRKLTAIAAGVMGLSIGFGAYMYNSKLQINENYQQALTNQARYLATESSKLLNDEDRIGALHLALAALPNEQHPDMPVIPEAVRAITNASLAYVPKNGIGLTAVWNYTMPDDIYDMEFSDQGLYMAAYDKSHNVRVWDCETHELVYQHDSSLFSARRIFFINEKVLMIEGYYALIAVDIPSGEIIMGIESLDEGALTSDYAVLENGEVLVGTENKGIYRLAPLENKILNKYRVSENGGTTESVEYTDFSLSPDYKKCVFYTEVEDGLVLALYDFETRDCNGSKLVVHEYIDKEDEIKKIKWIDDNTICVAAGKPWYDSNIGYHNDEIHDLETKKILCFNAENLSLRWKNEFTSNDILYEDGFINLDLINAVGYYSENVFEVWNKETGELKNRFDFNNPIVGYTKSENDKYPSFFTTEGTMSNCQVSVSPNCVVHSKYFNDGLRRVVTNKGAYVYPEFGREIIFYGLGVHDENYVDFEGTPAFRYIADGGRIVDDDYVVVMGKQNEKVAISSFDIKSGKFIRSTIIDESEYDVNLLKIQDGILYLSVAGIDNHALYSVDLNTGETKTLKKTDDWIATSFGQEYSDGIYVYADYGDGASVVVEVNDVMHGSTKKYNIGDNLYNAGESFIKYSPETNLIYASTTSDYIINTKSDEVIEVTEPDGWISTTKAEIVPEAEKILATDNSKIIAYNFAGEEVFMITCPEVNVACMTIHDNKLIVLYEDGTLYRYDAATGDYIDQTEVNYASFYYGSSFNFDDDNNRLYVAIGTIVNIIDTDAWILVGNVPSGICYNKKTDSFIALSEDDSGNVKVGYYKQYSIEELIERAQEMVEGAQMSESFKKEYGIG